MKRRVCMSFLIVSLWLAASAQSVRLLAANNFPHPNVVVVATDKG
ncbi:MAG TPA: hypothetical protein VGV38_05700 [Pyrinomonadaceae bacterium]|nr:hypothetical protein [Pyrinomonadaceae bacterium]